MADGPGDRIYLRPHLPIPFHNQGEGNDRPGHTGLHQIWRAAGIEAGGRTGFTAVIVGILFLPFLYLAPLIETVPIIATAPALILVGLYMIRAMVNIDFKKIDEGLPAFLALILIPLTYSITQGISWSFIFYTFLKVLKGEAREIHPMLYVIVIFAALALTLV